MRNAQFISLLLIAQAVISCSDTGPQGPPGASDKQTRVYFLPQYVSTLDSAGYLGFGSPKVPKFDKSYFVNVDSIILVCDVQTGGNNARCLVDLYNGTDSVFIATGLIDKECVNACSAESGNLYSILPNKEVDLYVRIRTSVHNTNVGIINPQLVMYRR